MFKKKIIFILLLMVSLSLLTLGCARNGQTDQGNNQEPTPDVMTVQDLYPLSVGDYWKFAGVGNEYAPFEQKVLFREDNRIQLQIVTAGTTLGMIYEFREGQLVVVYSQEELYEEENILDSPNQMESVILQEPIEPGATWQTEDGRNFEIIATDRTVETPAGSFANSVEIRATFTDHTAIMTMYYQPGLGLIKQEYQDGEFSVVQELEDYKMATYNN